MQSNYLYALSSCGTNTADGDSVNLRRGDVWAADDRFCRERPDLFTADITDCGPDLPRRTVAECDLPTERPSRRSRR
jgi:hypothetical protein